MAFGFVGSASAPGVLLRIPTFLFLFFFFASNHPPGAQAQGLLPSCLLLDPEVAIWRERG